MPARSTLRQLHRRCRALPWKASLRARMGVPAGAPAPEGSRARRNRRCSLQHEPPRQALPRRQPSGRLPSPWRSKNSRRRRLPRRLLAGQSRSCGVRMPRAPTGALPSRPPRQNWVARSPPKCRRQIRATRPRRSLRPKTCSGRSTRHRPRRHRPRQHRPRQHRPRRHRPRQHRPRQHRPRRRPCQVRPAPPQSAARMNGRQPSR
jgi:hypothetical protein